MDQKKLEENDSNFNCAKILHGVDEPIACPTPAKTSEPLPPKSKEGPIQLPEKSAYELSELHFLDIFFLIFSM